MVGFDQNVICMATKARPRGSERGLLAYAPGPSTADSMLLKLMLYLVRKTSPLNPITHACSSRGKRVSFLGQNMSQY